ncbi:MAG: hypothetical protein A2Y23_07160 [Clostridiales bacterium GWB2_37_7]|nr:MAG: hypothetical protein A2Y23_07160 [Clostridiales bacterium GWB2_37_7]
MVTDSLFKKLDDQEVLEFIQLGGLAYPFMNINTPEDVKKQAERFMKIQNEDPDANIYGAYREDKLVGGMQLQDFIMNFDGTPIKAGGVGFVAVDLLHKKEKVAKDIISYFIDHYQKQKVTVAMLYPFRPDFYKQMGFGFGAKMNQYKVLPANLPKAKHRQNLAYLTKQDQEQWIECYNSFAAKTHGMIKRTNIEITNMLAPGKNTVIYKQKDRIEGYLSFAFRKASDIHPLKNDIIIREFVYHSLEVFQQLLNFLHTQFDQIDRIVINTQDEYFHYLLKDPRDGSGNNFAPIYEQTNLQGIGLMYKIIDIEEFFRQIGEHSFNDQSLKLKLNIVDSFVKENCRPIIVEFKSGKPSVIGGMSYDAEISMDISDFSAMAMGCVEFRALLRLGLAEISSVSYAEAVNSLFRTKDKPICTTTF